MWSILKFKNIIILKAIEKRVIFKSESGIKGLSLEINRLISKGVLLDRLIIDF